MCYEAGLRCCDEWRVGGHGEFAVHDFDSGTNHGFQTAGYPIVFVLSSARLRISHRNQS